MCLACQTPVDPKAVEAFGSQFVEILNHAATALMISVGHRTGLFQTLMAMPPSTSAEIASASRLHERYVREWLGAMVTAGIVECDERGERFSLPAAHQTILSASGTESLAHLAQYIGLMGHVEDEIVECFHRGGGVPYSKFPRFHDVMAEDSGQTVVAALFDHILPLVPGLISRLRAGISVLDIGCGRGRALQILAERFPKSRFVGYDLSQQAITQARNEAVAAGLANLRFEQRDLTDFDDPDRESPLFDLITAFDAIHDQARPDRVLKGIRRALKSDGVFLMQDIGASSNVAENREHPIGPLLYTLSCMHCMTVSLAQGGLGVGAMWGEQMTRQFLLDAGFTHIKRHTFPHDIQNFYYLAHP
jgi:SAM-dependent methyltransferase